MTEPSQYFKGRTVQEQMDEVIGYVDVRSAEVAVNAIASDVAQVHQDMLDADADASAAAASAAAAAGTLANAVKKTGEASQSIAGNITVAGDLSGGTVTVPTPTNNTDAASKKYVDDADATKISITDINTYAVGLTGNQNVSGIKTNANETDYKSSVIDITLPGTSDRSFIINRFYDKNNVEIWSSNIFQSPNGIMNNQENLYTTVNGDTYRARFYWALSDSSLVYRVIVIKNGVTVKNEILHSITW